MAERRSTAPPPACGPGETERVRLGGSRWAGALGGTSQPFYFWQGNDYPLPV